jgi:hypothetical protein
MSDSQESSFKAWKIVLGAGALVAAVGTYFLVKSHFSGDEKKPKTHKKKPHVKAAKASKAAAKPQPAAAGKTEETKTDDRAPGNSELFSLVLQSIDQLQTKAEVDGPEEQRLLKILKAINPTKYEPKTRLAAAQWFILYHTIKTLSSQGVEEYKQCALQQKEDMEQTWRLLDCDRFSSSEQQASDLLRLDVGQRLKDAKKMAPVFDRVFENPNISYEEIVVTFTTAPLLGKWRATRELGARIIERQQSLEDFHRAAMHRPDIPDYAVLYEMAEAEAKHGDADLESLEWFGADLKDLKIRLNQVRCDDDDKRNEMEHSFDPQGNRDWKDLPTGGDNNPHRLLRFGAIAQMASLSTLPMQIVGPATSSRLRLSGRAELSIPDHSGSVVQTEEYLLEREEGDRWSGTYTLVQDPRGLPSPVKVEIVFDLRMQMQRVPDDAL